MSSVTARHTLPPQHERLLQLACEALDRCQEARLAIAEQGLVTENRYGATVAHPAVSIERDARLAFARLLRDMHLNEWPMTNRRLPSCPPFGGPSPRSWLQVVPSGATTA